MDLPQFINALKVAGDLKEITVPVNKRLELAALCRREFRRENGGQALLFHNIKDSDYPVVANLFGSQTRLSGMLHSATLDEFRQRIKEALTTPQSSDAISGIVANKPVVQPQWQSLAKTCLAALPAIQSWPRETQGYLTLALAVTADPVSGEPNLGLYRAQILAESRIAVNFASGSGAARHLAIARELGQPLPIALVLGSDPALIWLAAAPLPTGWNELGFYRSLFGNPLPLADCTSQPLQVPADAELIIEGEIAIGQTAPEGPFGNHTGQYVTRQNCPLMQVTAIVQRPEPILPLTVVGPPPSENVQLAAANEILILELLALEYPQIHDLWMPLETFFHGAAVIALEKQGRQQVRELVNRLWQNGPLQRSRLLVLVDRDISLKRPADCWWRAVNRLDNERIYQSEDRLAIDATGVDPEQLVVEDAATAALLAQRCTEYDLSE